MYSLLIEWKLNAINLPVELGHLPNTTTSITSLILVPSWSMNLNSSHI